jgi:hypothetical protein
VLTYADIELRLDNLVGFDGDSDEGPFVKVNNEVALLWSTML